MNAPDYTAAYARPEIYDILHSPHTAAEVEVFVRCAREHGAPDGRWLEPACGTGRYLHALARRGIECTGFDLDEGMLRYARASLARRPYGPRAELLEADMAGFLHRLRRRRFAVAFNPVNTFRHLHRGADASRHLREVAAALRPGGLYLVGISFARYGEEEPTEDVWTARRGNCSVRQIVQYLPAEPGPRLERVFSHLQVDRPGGRQYHDSTYALRSYDQQQWRGLVRRSPLRRIGAVDDLGREVGPEIETDYQIEILARPR